MWRPLKRHDSHVAEQMVERAAELARDSHSQTRYAAVLVKHESLLAWGTNGVPLGVAEWIFACPMAWSAIPRLTMTLLPSCGGSCSALAHCRLGVG